MHHLIEQNTDEWMELRRGKFTASSFSDLFLKPTTAGYRNAIFKVVYERLTGEQPESFTNDWMQRGHELEPFAVQQYELETFNTVLPGGFFELNDYVGASPDGLIGEDGLLEIKCPAYSTMIQYLMDQKLPTQYKWQVQGQLYVTGRKWTDFFAYHPKLKPIIIRIDRDEVMISELEQKLFDCIKEVETIITKLK